jgi:hypothetical protein
MVLGGPRIVERFRCAEPAGLDWNKGGGSERGNELQVQSAQLAQLSQHTDDGVVSSLDLQTA